MSCVICTVCVCVWSAYIKRVIAHPSFHNVDYKTCEKLMDTMDQGDVIIRPSSKVSVSLSHNYLNVNVAHKLIIT